MMTSKTAAGLLLAAAMAGACAAPLTTQQLQADFQLARGALEEAHGGIYRYTPKAQLDRVFDAAATKLNRPMEAMEFQRILAPAVAALRCGHTAVLLSPELKIQMAQALLLPLDVKLVQGRLFILRDFDGAGKLAGRELVSVNGVATGSIVRQLLAAAPGDGFTATGRTARVARKFREELFIQLGMQGRFALGLRAEGGTEVVTLAGQTLAVLRQASASRYPQDQRSKRFLQLSLLDEGMIARLQVFNFSDEEEDGEGGAILKQAFEQIAASGAHTLLLDLRDNGGGLDRLGKLLFSHLVDAPFGYYAQLTVRRAELSFAEHVEGYSPIPAHRLAGHPNLGMQKKGAPAFRGKVIALINGGSFSTTSEVITQLHDKKRATFVGEESGGAYHGSTSGADAPLVLPNSGLRVAIPLVAYTLAVDGRHPNGRGVVPEVEVVPTMGDYLSGRDVVLEKALKIARSK